MAQVIAPPGNDNDEIFEAMQKLMRDSQVTRSAHFIAKQRKERTFQIVGVSVIVLNILIGSGLIEAAFANNPNAITITIKLLAFLAAALAGIQAFFNFQKAVECHIKSGGVYSSIAHRLNLIMAEYQEQPANRPALLDNFKALNDEFLKANDDATVCIPADRDFDKAHGGIKARES
jgi:hypothetical protein